MNALPDQPHIENDPVERVHNFEILGVHIDETLTRENTSIK